ncbi:MerC domain-containing protein [Emticicia fluvialis]|uniref:MerC domain-containing protein n=1 Tax=Emticicia fluvialis TaxID=2974474 RepID=UPI002166943D|nr:MerC domain-containing protein [Emticicia fluvialis]
MRKIFTHYHNLNKVGLWLSILCMVHCLAMPFIITSLPYLSKNTISEKSEFFLIAISACLAVYLLLKDYKNHRNSLPLALLTLALAFNMLGIFIVSNAYETIFNVSGGLLMSLAYGLNWYFHKRACHSHQH